MTWQPGPAVSVFAAGLFEDKVAVITGGGTGLGREVAHGFGRASGAHVVIAGRTARPAGRGGRRPSGTRGGSCLAVPTNIRETGGGGRAA